MTEDERLAAARQLWWHSNGNDSFILCHAETGVLGELTGGQWRVLLDWSIPQQVTAGRADALNDPVKFAAAHAMRAARDLDAEYWLSFWDGAAEHLADGAKERLRSASELLATPGLDPDWYRYATIIAAVGVEMWCQHRQFDHGIVVFLAEDPEVSR